MPALGPPIAFPESFEDSLRATWTGGIMGAMEAEYRNIRVGAPLSGFGYFVAIPSFHVAVAALAQSEFAKWPWLFWAILPINMLLIVSTVLLGYHYLVDLPAGLLLAAALGPALRRTPKG